MGRPLMVVAAVCLLGAPLLAQGTFPLKYVAVGDAPDPVLSMSTRMWGVETDPPGDVKGPPKEASGKVVYARAQVGEKTCWMAVEAGETPRLWVGASGNGDLRDAKAIAGKTLPQMLVFGDVTVPVSDKESVHCRIEARTPQEGAPPRYLLVRPAGYMAGEVRLADRTYRVALVDGDLNGRYDDRLEGPFSPTASDSLSIDLNGDGQFARPTLEAEPWEWMPLVKGLKAGDAYYTADPAPDGLSLVLAKAGVQTGTLDLGSPDVEVAGIGSFGFQRTVSADGKVAVPAGRYLPVGISLVRTDKNGETWRLRYSGGAEKLDQIEIRPGETYQAKIGPPLVAKTEVGTSSSGDAGNQGRKTVSIGLALVGRSGEAYAPGAMKGKTQAPAPKFEIQDEAGKVLQSGQFEYG